MFFWGGWGVALAVWAFAPWVQAHPAGAGGSPSSSSRRSSSTAARLSSAASTSHGGALCAPRSRRRWVARKRWGQHKKLIDVRYASGRKHTRVVVLVSGSLSGVAEGEAEAQPNKGLPFRVYVDLTPCVPLRYWTRTAFRIKDKRVGRLRIGRNTLRTTRVVLELSRKLDYRVTMLRSPMRIVIDVGNTLPASPTAKMRTPMQAPTPIRRGRRRRNKKRTHRAPGSWRPAKGKPWVLRMSGALHLPFAFRVGRIAIDAGHGGREDGAVGRRTRLTEKTVTLDLARRVKKALRRRLRGVQVFLIRKRDRTLSLDQRVARIKRGKADLLISLHVNSNLKRRLNGVATYVLHWSQRFNVARMLSSNALIARENQGVHPKQFRGGVSALLNSMKLQSNLVLSKYLGLVVQRSLLKRLRKRYPKTRDLGVRRGLFYLLFSAGVPAILVESSFLSNPREERLLRTKTYRQQIANGIVDGVVRFVKMSRASLRRRSQRLPRK